MRVSLLLTVLLPSVLRAGAPELVIQTGHSLPVVAVALSRDSRWLATGSRDGTAILWEAGTGHKLRELKAEPLGVTAVAFSPDGKTLLTGGAGTAKLWETATGRLARKFGVPGEFLTAVDFTPDGGSVLTAGDDGAVKLWDAASGRKIRTFGPATSRVSATALSRDGRRLAYAAGGEQIWVWALDTGQLVQELAGPGPWTSLAFSPDGRSLASGSQDSVRLWEVASGRDTLSFKGNAGRAVAFVPGGRGLASCGGTNTARFWESGSGKPSGSLIGHLDSVNAMALSADGRLAVTGSEDHTARLWDIASGRSLRSFGGAGLPVLYAAVVSNGRRLVTVDPQKAELWDIEAGRPVSRSTGDWETAAHFAVSRDGRWLASIRDREEVELRGLEGDADAGKGWSLIKAHALALDPGGRFLVTAREESLQAWEIPAASEKTLLGGRTERAGWLGVGLEGRRLVTRGPDGAVELWDLEGGRRIARFKFEGASMPDLVLSRDGRYLAAGAASSRGRGGSGRYVLSIRAMSDGEEMKGWQTEQAITPLAFGPGGDSLLVLAGASAWEWDLLTGRKKNAFSIPEGASLDWPEAVDPGWRYALARREEGLSVVSLATGKELGLLRLSEKGWLLTTPDGRIDAAPEAARWTDGLKSLPFSKVAGPSVVPGLLGKLLLGEPP
ncbi:MAG: WD40 repeat domain-containing protein [Elusimicrobia bacterium]|nr:WD40 repeat domain-containing protein [Elusimicrobiota bacterium]